MTDESSTREVSGSQDTPVMEEVDEVDEVVDLKDSICMDQYQMEILKGKAVKPPAHDNHIMIAPLRCSVVESGKAHPLPPGLQVLHTYTTLTAGSKMS